MDLRWTICSVGRLFLNLFIVRPLPPDDDSLPIILKLNAFCRGGDEDVDDPDDGAGEEQSSEEERLRLRTILTQSNCKSRRDSGRILYDRFSD